MSDRKDELSTCTPLQDGCHGACACGERAIIRRERARIVALGTVMGGDGTQTELSDFADAWAQGVRDYRNAIQRCDDRS